MRRSGTKDESKNERNCESKRIELKGDTVREYFRRREESARERKREGVRERVKGEDIFRGASVIGELNH